MTKILFICHGNICRSPMAQFVFTHLAKQQGVLDQFEIQSCATSSEETGNPVHPGTLRKMREEGIPVFAHFATKLTRQDYDRYDYLIGMEQHNIRNIMRIIGKDPQNKVHRLLDFTPNPRDIADPWYTGNFEDTYQDVLKGCQALLAHITGQKQL